MPVDLQPVVEGAWDRADTDGLTMAADVEGQVVADPTRMRDLFESGFTFAAHNDASMVTVSRRPTRSSSPTTGPRRARQRRRPFSSTAARYRTPRPG